MQDQSNPSTPMDEMTSTQATPRRSTLPLAAAVLILWSLVAAMWILSIHRNDGHLVYALDDAYIHMAIAKNVVQHGVWGVTPYEFSSASSSYLWTILLSLTYMFTGVNVVGPLLLNVLFATLLLFVYWRLVNEFEPAGWYVFCGLLVLILVAPLVILVFGGMEHILHTILTLIFVAHVSQELASDSPGQWSWRICRIYALIALMVLVRFESLAILLVAVTFSFLRKRWRMGLTMLAIGLFLVLATAGISLANGGLMLPNSVLIKAEGQLIPRSLEAVVTTLLHAAARVTMFPYLGVTTLIAWFLYCWRARHLHARFWDRRQILLLIFIPSMWLQLLFGKAGWLFRYEAYVMVLGIFVIMTACCELFAIGPQKISSMHTNYRAIRSARVSFVIMLLLCLVPFSFSFGRPGEGISGQVTNLYGRIVLSLKDLPVQLTNIYQQHVQMGLFLGRYHDTDSVVANDIGAICYFSNVHIIDLVGLGNNDIARVRLSGVFNAKVAQGLAESKGAQIAVIYEKAFRDPARGVDNLPRSWIPVGKWKIHDNRICWNDVVTFFAVTRDAAPSLAKNLADFSVSLPKQPIPVEWTLLQWEAPGR